MSGIAGLFNLNKEKLLNVDTSGISDSISNRGTEKTKSLSYDFFSLYHSKLILDPHSKEEELPHYDKFNQLFIVSDARIDNKEELERTLNLAPNQDDSSVILESYKKWGFSSPAKLIGAFSFVIFDKKNDLIFAARDHMGMKPLYYSINRGKFIFSSNISTILRNTNFLKKMNRERIIDFLLFFSPKEGETFYESIKKLPRSHYLIIKSENIKLVKYFDFDIENKTIYKNAEEYSEHFYELFSSIISDMNKRSYGNVGMTLSGGLDSSSIYSLSKKNNQGSVNIHSRSVIFKGLSKDDFKLVDEKNYMQDCINQYPNEYHRFIELDGTGPISNLQKMTSLFDSPAMAINGYIYSYVFESLRSENVRVMMDGLDGDSVVSYGHELFPELAIRFKLLQLFKLANQFNEVNKKGQPSKYKVLKKNLVFTMIPNRLYWIYRNMGPNKLIQYQMFNCLNEPVKDRINLYERFKNHSINFSLKPSGNARKDHKLSMSGVNWETAIESLEPLSSESKIEHRMPFFDRRLMEYCLSIPPEMKIKNGVNRYVFRKAMNGTLPESIRNRYTKSDLSPFAIREINAMPQEELDNLIFSNESPLHNLVDKLQVRLLFERLKLPTEDRSTLVFNLYRFISLSSWMKKEGFKWNN